MKLVPSSPGPMARDVDSLALCMQALLCDHMFSLDPTVPPLPFNMEVCPVLWGSYNLLMIILLVKNYKLSGYMVVLTLHFILLLPHLLLMSWDTELTLQAVILTFANWLCLIDWGSKKDWPLDIQKLQTSKDRLFGKRWLHASISKHGPRRQRGQSSARASRAHSKTSPHTLWSLSSHVCDMSHRSSVLIFVSLARPLLSTEDGSNYPWAFDKGCICRWSYHPATKTVSCSI